MTEPVFQPEGSNYCVLACIASVTGHPLYHVIDIAVSLDIDIEVGVSLAEEYAIFQKLDYDKHIIIHSIMSPCLFADRTYLVTVPSLSIKGGLHRIVIQCKLENGICTPVIHDTQPVGERYGITQQLVSFVEVVEIVYTNLKL